MAVVVVAAVVGLDWHQALGCQRGALQHPQPPGVRGRGRAVLIGRPGQPRHQPLWQTHAV